jgi:hypothetical protein
MHLKAHKLVLIALLLFGVGLLAGTSLGNMYRRYNREADFARLVKAYAGSGTIEPGINHGDFPREVAGMVRTNLLAGEEATKFVYSYLGNERNLSSAYIGTYKDSQREVVIFVATFYSPEEAEDVLASMKKTLYGKDSFKECGEKSILDDVTVNFLQEANNSHYFYSKGTRVIWLMAGAGECIEVLTDFYRYF